MTTDAPAVRLPHLHVWRDSTGRVVLAQVPNPPILLWIACVGIARLLDVGTARTGVERLGRAALFAWAYLEVTSGVNWFRRGLGAVVLGVVAVSFFR